MTTKIEKRRNAKKQARAKKVKAAANILRAEAKKTQPGPYAANKAVSETLGTLMSIKGQHTVEIPSIPGAGKTGHIQSEDLPGGWMFVETETSQTLIPPSPHAGDTDQRAWSVGEPGHRGIPYDMDNCVATPTVEVVYPGSFKPLPVEDRAPITIECKVVCGESNNPTGYDNSLPEPLTDQHRIRNLMRSSRSSEEWNINADKVKEEFTGYPAWWYQEIIMSGLYSIVVSSFPENIKV